MSAPRWIRLAGRAGDVGGLPIVRALPHRERRTIGAWCFLDHAGPALLQGHGMDVPPHPHTGLQTFSWMIDGEVLHRDSLGHEQVLRPGQVNLMTAGRGIAHSEQSLGDRLHLAQLWIALPDEQRFCAPAFEHFPVLPVMDRGGFSLTLLVGELLGARSPVTVHSPLLGADLACAGAADSVLPLQAGFEHGLMVLEGALEVEADEQPAERLAPGSLLALEPGFQRLRLRADAPARALLLGGEPLAQTPLLWWNFVGRTGEEIAGFAQQWNSLSGDFADAAVPGYTSSSGGAERLLSPEVPALRTP
ncbi:MAG: pirin family protein [Pelomonas sp.]|nr:pirin family protein [Burkholderiaceae bacterium]MBV8605061.1 pirin family protein [Roseateles sp.]